LISELGKAYELLGVKPGVSMRELKAAHRDLAKVWHPDRFGHDPRLQEKAQEKLKEFNEAYELISSGKIPRSAPTAETSTPPPSRPGRGRVMWVPVILFAAVFALTTKWLIQQRSQPVAEPQTQAEQVEQKAETRPDQSLRGEAIRKTKSEAAAVDAPATEVAPSQPAEPVATVTVTIDPQSGLIAKSDCPVRSRITYPRGSEPSGHCNLVHTPPPKKSRLEAITEKILPQRRKGAKEEPVPSN
jgi:hypothetical protein